MRISVFGIGYVGAVASACLARDGHDVIAVDVNPVKVEAINSKQSPVAEEGLQELISEGIETSCLEATTDPAAAVKQTDMTLVCVGTPSRANGSLNLDHVEDVCTEIGTAIRRKKGHHAVVMRSTILPGTMRNFVIPMIEAASGKQAGVDFGVGFNPEFLREGTAIRDYDNPAKTVIGTLDAETGDALESVYAGLPGSFIRTTLDVAEMVKYADNSWHALKVAYANEIGAICKEIGVDSHVVMDIFCQDRKLNISAHYLRPGFAFGGSCLPKDVRALSHFARRMDIETPVLSAILPSNRTQIERGLDIIRSLGKKRIGMLGLTFKAGTDDLREAPMVEVIETLMGKGYEVRIYDSDINLDILTGANRQYIDEHIPHVVDFIETQLDDVMNWAEVLVIGKMSPEFRDVPAQAREEQVVLDFVRVNALPPDGSSYAGISW